MRIPNYSQVPNKQACLPKYISLFETWEFAVGGVDLVVVVVVVFVVVVVVVVVLVVVVVDSGVGGIVGSVWCTLFIFQEIFSNKCFAKNMNIITVEPN